MGEFIVTTYKAIMPRKRVEEPNDHFELIMRSNNHVLSPSWKLLNNYKYFLKRNEPVTWKEGKEYKYGTPWQWFTFKFVEEMRNNFEAVHGELERLREIVKAKNVHLVCWEKDYIHCHRNLVKKILEREIYL